MGTDNLHSKRKIKKDKDLKRNKSKREPYDKVLIVCEGQKTEPHYFNEILRVYKISSANVRVDGNCGSSPSSVVEKAEELYQQEVKNDPYDRVYCVFDKDSHSTFSNALDRIKNLKPKNTFFAVTSIPCFEYWILLHFKYTSKPYYSVGKKSSGDMVMSDLNNAWPEYKKNMEGVFKSIFDKLESAKKYAIRANNEANANQTDNPTTEVHELVSYLQEIKIKK